MNLSNNLFVLPGGTYKAYAGKGNNELLVRITIKSRWWWQMTDKDDSSINFVWTQLRKNDFIEKLRCLKSNVSMDIGNNNGLKKILNL